MIEYTNQITIIHFSDLHFGSQHICNPEDITASRDGIPELCGLLVNDLSTGFGATFIDQSIHGNHVESPVFVAITGDFTQRAESAEFQQALAFLKGICDRKILNKTIEKSDIFMVPGNHDVVFTEKTPKERFQNYISFYNEFFDSSRPTLSAHKALSITQLHKLEKEGSKVLIAEINCCMYVQKDTIDESRGQVASDAIAKLREELISHEQSGDLDEYIKIALIHHHVVLIPSFIESWRGVDSVVNAKNLLELLSEYNFHIVLHGHKHYPHIFSYDPIPLWNDNETKIPQLIIAGGSCGSSELPDSTHSCNTYGVIQIKWHPAAKQARVKIITRGLKRRGPKGLLPPDLWKWETVNTSEKVVTPIHSLPFVKKSALSTWITDERVDYYEKLRGQMPVVEVMPSLIPQQAYEARAWIVPHPHGSKLAPNKELKKVEWCAGEMFSVQTATKQTNTDFCIAFHYWGPMAIQAKLTFEDGYEATGFVYARMPKYEQ